MAHMSVEALICPLQGILSIAQREGEQQWRQGKNAFDKWSHVQLRFFMKWFLLWYTYALLLGENLLAKMAFQNIVVVSERRLPILCMGRRKPGYREWRSSDEDSCTSADFLANTSHLRQNHCIFLLMPTKIIRKMLSQLNCHVKIIFSRPLFIIIFRWKMIVLGWDSNLRVKTMYESVK